MDADIPPTTDCVIAAIRVSHTWNYYAAPVDIWVLDWDSWTRTFVSFGYVVPEMDAKERSGVRVLDERSVHTALSALADRRVSEQQLRQALREQLPIHDWEQVAHLFPAILIDFDSQHLISMYSETLELERYVPSGWKGEFRNVLDEIPVPQRYWIDGPRNYLDMATGRP